MMFVIYDINTGEITAHGYMDKIYVQQAIDKGEPLIPVDHDGYDKSWRVNLTTKELERKVINGASAP